MRFLTFILLFTSLPSVAQIVVGAADYDEYKHITEGQNVGLVVNQTSVVEGVHLIDLLFQKGNNIKTIFAPEHGYRGLADAGENINNSVDEKTGIPVISLYGNNKKPTREQLQNLDCIVFDIQDVGVRFYTFISTMHYVMEACAENNIELVILDRPNPNGHYIDGPVLDIAYSSFVGLHPIPVVHGLTIGELALMINEEKWLKNGVQCNLKVVPCKNYTHKSIYNLPIAPSPNLPNMKAIYLYPSLCFFEGAEVSCGRGTNKQFQVYGSPVSTYGDYTFTPQPNTGAKSPKFNGQQCRGFDLSNISENELRKKGFDLNHFIDFYNNHPQKDNFFTKDNFFNKLAGNAVLKYQITNGVGLSDIKKLWEKDLNAYKIIRKKYLLYPDFE